MAKKHNARKSYEGSHNGLTNKLHINDFENNKENISINTISEKSGNNSSKSESHKVLKINDRAKNERVTLEIKIKELMEQRERLLMVSYLKPLF